MNTNKILKSFATLLTAFTVAFCVPTLQADALRMEAKIEGKASYAEGKSQSKTQTRQIEVTITNNSEKSVDGVVVKWVIYGHEMKDHQLMVIKEGEEKISVPANESKVVKSPEIKITGNREYKISSKSGGKSKGGRGRSRTTTKTMPASGEEYYGYGVEVYWNGKVVDSYYSQPSIEKEMQPTKQ